MATKRTSVNKSTTDKNVNKAMNNSAFHKFFVDSVKDIFWAENNLLKMLSKMKKAATSKKLSQTFEAHQDKTKHNIEKLKQIFELLGKKAAGVKCEAMAGIIKEGQEIIDDTKPDTMTRDAALILAAQKAEHYGIATYGTLRVFANHMQHTKISGILAEVLEVEKNCDVILTKLAESFINEEAAEE